jgi:transmembrane sensor
MATKKDVVILRDGSRAEPIEAGTRLAVVSDRSERVRVRVQQGAAHFEVVHNPARVFEVESGPVIVRVAGTVFDVQRTQDGARVTVESGRVHVSWAGRTIDLVGGQAHSFATPEPEIAAQTAPRTPAKAEPAGDSDTAPALRGGASSTAPALRGGASSRALGWRDLAQRGEYKQAYSALHGAPTRVQDVPEDLMLAADVARLSGHPEQAVPHLREVCDRFPGDPRAPVAAFTLGGVLLHELHEPRAAAAAFHRARALWSQGPLALDAWASEAEALDAAGDTTGAAQLAVRYLALHPDGRHARAMRALASAE